MTPSPAHLYDETMLAFARTCAAIAATAAKLEKIALVASYLRDLDDLDLAPAARFFGLVSAAHAAWGVDNARLRETGDLGAARGPLVQAPNDLGLFRETLTPAGLSALLEDIAAANGKNARKRAGLIAGDIGIQAHARPARVGEIYAEMLAREAGA